MLKVTNDAEHDAAVEQLIAWNQAPDTASHYADIEALGAIVEAYEEAAGHSPDPPRTLRGILEVEMFKRRLRQRDLAQLLEIPESRLSELLRGKRVMNLDFARRLYTKLAIPAEVILNIAA